MTSTESPSSEFDIAAFITANQRAVYSVVIGVVTVGAAAWIWTASANRTANNAEQAYATAERSYFSGNPQLAETDLKRVVERYGGTTAGVRASMLLARHFFEQSKPADGVAALRAAIGRGSAKPFRPGIYGLIGAGFEAENKFDSAATAYRAASSEAATQGEREQYQASAARALMSGGDKVGALKLWQAIAARELSPLAGEAKLRIGELSAVSAKGT
jgi:predicted negative regulator of RcsB-dependent stress response